MHESERWDAILRSRTGDAGCIVEWEGDDPESLFVELVDEHLRGAGRVLRISGSVSLELSWNDAEPLTNHCSVAGDASSLPFADGAFDLICLCLIPGAGMQSAFQECARVLDAGGMLLGLVAGETHRIETQEIFGRGVGWPPSKPVRFEIPEVMRATGLEISFLAEYFGASFCPDLQSFVADLEACPIIPDFDPTKDAALVREVQRKLTCERGIRNTEHLALYAAWKRA